MLIAAIDLVFAPWIYTVGGRTRLLPLWAGVAVAQTPLGRYTIHVWFSPIPSGSHVLASTSVSGTGYVCTPSGKRYSLKVTGGASGRIWKDMDGHAFSFSAYHRPAFAGLTGGDHRPKLQFSGQWVGSNLQMSDEGSIAQAFLADGSLSAQNSPRAKDSAIPITFNETTWWIEGSCGKR